MSPVALVPLCAVDILLYSARAYTNKLFAMSYDGPAAQTTPIFSSVTGLAGFVFALILSGGVQLPSLTTLLCGICGGCVLFLFDMGNLRAARTGPYSIQSVICIFGAVTLPMLFEALLWDVSLTVLQLVGIASICVSFVFLNLNKGDSVKIQKGFFGWVALSFFANGIYSTILIAQQRWTGYVQRQEMIAVVLLTMSVVSVLYLVLGCRAEVKTAFRLKGKSWGYALISAFSMCAAMNILVVLLKYINASVLYPIENSVIIILQVLLSALHLKERLSVSNVAGILFALCGMVILNL